MEFRIRQARKTELPQLKEYAALTYRDLTARHPQAFPQDVATEAHSPLDASFRNKTEIEDDQSPNLLVAVTETDEVAGYILLSWWAGRPEGVGYDAQINDVFTVPKFRNQGVARTLIAHAAQMTGENGIHALRARVWAGTPGLDNLFKNTGFAEEHTVLYFGPPSEPPSLRALQSHAGHSTNRQQRGLPGLSWLLLAVGAGLAFWGGLFALLVS